MHGASSRWRDSEVTSRDRVFLWPFFETRLFFEAVARSWRRILFGAFVGWAVASVAGAVLLVVLERLDVITWATSDMLAVVIVLTGTGIGAMVAYARRPAGRRGEPRSPSTAQRGGGVEQGSESARERGARPPGRRSGAGMRSPRGRGAPRPRGIGEETGRRRRSRAANR